MIQSKIFTVKPMKMKTGGKYYIPELICVNSGGELKYTVVWEF